MRSAQSDSLQFSLSYFQITPGRMFHSRTLVAFVAVSLSCGSQKSEVVDYTQFRKPERTAIALACADLFKDDEQITSGTKLGTLQMATSVFVLDDTLKSGGTSYRKVVLGDSAAYVASSLVLTNASPGVVDGALLGPVMITTEPQLGF